MTSARCICPSDDPYECARIRDISTIPDGEDFDFMTMVKRTCECSCHEDWYEWEQNEWDKQFEQPLREREHDR